MMRTALLALTIVLVSFASQRPAYKKPGVAQIKRLAKGEVEAATQYWEAYLAELKAANASRLPAIPVGHWSPKD